MAARGAGAIPLAAICCLGLILFGIAATIVLALIPVYLSSKSATLAAVNTKQKSLSYTVPLSSGRSVGLSAHIFTDSERGQLTTFLLGALTPSVQANGGLTVTSAIADNGVVGSLFLVVLIFARFIGVLNEIQSLLNTFIVVQQSALVALADSIINSSTTTTAASAVSTTAAAASTASGRRRRAFLHRRQQTALVDTKAYKD